MTAWPRHPTIYEINTWVWLHALSQRYGKPIALGDVPAAEWDALAMCRFDAVWLMGVWERSAASARIARAHPDLQVGFRAALPDFTPEDVIGSPYAVGRYVVDRRLGGPAGLAAARAALAARGLRLILDFVPNHVAVDHPWLAEHPEYFIQGVPDDLEQQPRAFFRAGEHVVAHGRDPYFPAWTDTAQLNAFHPGLRQAAIDTLRAIADQCDGVRVDMAMLPVGRIFAGTWGARAGEPPAAEYWPEVLGAVRQTHPDLLLMAEVYWDMEWELQHQGFDYCYDKRLYDRLAHGDPPSVNAHLEADPDYQARLVRFIENHDEPRAAAVFDPRLVRAAAVIAATLPGARLFHEGQLEGARIRLPVQLRRRHPEPPDGALGDFYRALLAELHAAVFHDGVWRLCQRSGWPDNASYRNLAVWCWRLEEERRLIVVNLGRQPAQGRIRLPWDDLAGGSWRLHDALSGETFIRTGDELRDPGLYVGLEAGGVHFLHLTTG